MAPEASRTSGMRMPHGMEEAAAHAPQQTRSVAALVPGGFTQLSVPVQSEPTPVQSAQVRPSVSTESAIGSPHVTALAAGQLGQHASATQVEPASQRVPRPVQSMLAMHVSGMSVPQSTMSAARHASRQLHTPSTHVRPLGQGPLQRPPQPSESPHAASSAHVGMQSQTPVSGLHSSCGPGHAPTQKPPQPSGAPHAASAAQRGVQLHTPPMQRAGATHAGSQSHVATQVPFWQTEPRSQVTP